MKTFLIAFACFISAIVSQNFSYNGATGPLQWKHLFPDECKSNGEQSPVDINYFNRSTDASFLTLHQESPVEFVNWGEVTSSVSVTEMSLTVNLSSSGMQTKYEDSTYNVSQVHFHTPSEHLVDGKYYPIDAHFVHVNAEDSSLMVVGVFFDVCLENDEEERDADDIFEDILEAAAETGGDPLVSVPMEFDGDALLKKLQGAVSTYTGSLTTPMCSGPVKWVHYHTPLNISLKTWRSIKSILHFNSRPTQPRPSDAFVEGWSYVGNNGLETWSDLCSSGEKQSPINLSLNDQSPESKHVQLKRNIASPGVWNALNISANIKSYSLTLSFPEGQLSTSLDGRSYNVSNIHIHTPSEHRIEKDYFAAEMHIVHQSAEGTFAVLGVLLDVDAKSESKFIGEILRNFKKNETSSFVLDFAQLFKEELFYPMRGNAFTYDGSLTVPPCTEGISWFVLKTPVLISLKQWSLLREIMGFTARPTMLRK